jgi:hypothetical protein
VTARFIVKSRFHGESAAITYAKNPSKETLHAQKTAAYGTGDVSKALGMSNTDA